MLQELWIKKFGWNEELPYEVACKWFKLKNNYHHLENLRIPRWIHTSNNVNAELIGFCDASERSYSAVIYLRTIDENKRISIVLLTAKTKVAPIKKMSIPRLELCGALLLMKVYKFVVNTLNLKSIEVTAITDSSIVVSWLSGHPSKWKQFVGFRTAQIIEILPATKWKHVTSKDNPADCASRGILPESLVKNSLWWEGPHWLKIPKSEWPESSSNANVGEIDIESKKIKSNALFITTTNDSLIKLFKNCSSLSKILRILSYCRRMFRNQGKETYITTDELHDALNICIKWVQNEYFHDDIKLLKQNKNVHSKLKNLHPFLDENGLLRVDGRIDKSEVSFDCKHPYVMPKDVTLYKLIIKELYVKHLHAGPTLLMNTIRQKFWIFGLRIMVKREIYNCVTCARYKAETCQQLMSSLPQERVTPGRPFLHTGLDYCGSFNIKLSTLKNAKIGKAYLAVFVCLSTKAAHLEVVSDISTEAFLSALRRFISRRGIPHTIYSDNGTNFVGAKNQLHIMYNNMLKNKAMIGEFMSNNLIKWKMIPPGGPHHGGLWESCVKSSKTHFKKVIGDHHLTFEELTTVFIQIEAQLNSRPLVPLYENDPENLDVLTPGHFLIGSALSSLPDQNLIDVPVPIRNKWSTVTKITQNFWSCWKTDYLNAMS